MQTPNQLNLKREDVVCTEAALLQIPEGTITEEVIRTNIIIGILYMESWLRGNGAAAIFNCMEDAATAEISRSQLWQWLHYNVRLADGRIFNQELYEQWRDDEIEKIKQLVGSIQYQQGKFVQAICLFNKQVVNESFEEFLTLSAYDTILSNIERKSCEEQPHKTDHLQTEPPAEKSMPERHIA